MSVLLGCLSPHPPIIIPEIGSGSLRDVEDTVLSMESLAERVTALKPDLLVTISPHGPVFSDAINITGRELVRGSFSDFGVPGVELAVENNLDFAERLIDRAGASGISTTLLSEEIAHRFGINIELDHGVLVPLYYLQKMGLDCEVVPITMGLLSYEELYHFGKCIQNTAEGMGLQIVVLASGDLSHRLTPDAPAGFNPLGKKFDEQLINLLAAGDVAEIFNFKPSLVEKAGECGLRPIIMMLGALDGREIEGEILSYEGPFGVGYAVGTFLPGSETESLIDPLIKGEERGENTKVQAGESAPVRLARKTVEEFTRKHRRISPPDDLPSWLREKSGGVFVSIKKQGELRGCIGTTASTENNLAEEIISNAISAGFRDPRFMPITRDELPELDYSVDILSRPEKISGLEELDVERFGVIVKAGARTGLLLPDLEGVDTVEEQVDIARRKAGIPSWEDDLDLYRFEVKRYR